MTPDEEEKNQPIKTDPELTQVIEVADKDIKTVLTNICHMFRSRWRH